MTTDGTDLPAGTTIIAVADGAVRDRITMQTSGQYGGSDATADKLRVSSGIDSNVSFYVEKDDGTRIKAEEVDPDPTAEVEQFNLTFPVGTINPQPNVAVTDVTPSKESVIEGERLSISGTLTNTGTEDGTQVISLEIDSQTVRTTERTLAPDETQTVTFSDIGTSGLAAGEHDIEITSADGAGQATFTVRRKAANFTVSQLDPASPTVTNGTTLEVSATVTNEGTVEGTQTVAYRVDGRTLESRELTLATGENTEVVFSGIATGAIGPGTYAHGIHTANDSQQGTLTITKEGLSPANFQVSGLTPTETTVTEGDTIEVVATVSNDGEERGTQSVQLQVDGSVADSLDVTLASGESTTVTFSGVETGSLASGSHPYSIRTANGSQRGTLTVENRPTPVFTVTSVSPSGVTVPKGETVTISAELTNDGERQGTQALRLRLDGSEVASQSVTLASGESTTVEFAAIETSTLASGTHSYRVASENTSRSGLFTVSQEESETPTETATATSTVTATPTATSNAASAPTETPPTQTATASTQNETVSPTNAGNTSTVTPTPGSSGGLLPTGLIQPLLYYIGLPLLVIYLILKAMAIYLGY
ncbi:MULTISPECIES: CARDB domain-containing protein [Salinibaculum]|uniref:CARDB domain-containing protein n=1 Tax=Salinibaculum TaxID=2732368 RepID=UPI0030D155BD